MPFPLEDKLAFVHVIPDGEFKFVQLDDKAARKVKIGAYLSPTVENDLIKWLRENVDLFACSPEEMLGIYPSVACHKLNVNSEAKPMSQKMCHQTSEKVQAAR